MAELDALREQVREFVRERDWDQFHSPKNLAMALSVEAAELLEIFQWLTEDESRHPQSKALAAARDEIADVFIYLLRISEKLGVDPVAEAKRKLALNAAKYPVDKARGNARKYDEL